MLVTVLDQHISRTLENEECHVTKRSDDEGICATSEIDFIKAAQGVSVSGAPVNEAFARCVRELLPVFVAWLNAEDKRGTPDEVVLAAIPAVLPSIMFTALLNLIKDKDGIRALEKQMKLATDHEWARALDLALKQA